MYQIQHPWDQLKTQKTELSTNSWLMSYGQGIQLPYIHWEQISHPKFIIPIFKSDASGEMATGKSKVNNDETVASDESGELAGGGEVDNSYINVGGIRYDIKTIIVKAGRIKKAITDKIKNLNTEESVILDLPVLEWRSGFKYGAVCMLNWLEGSEESIKIPYDFVTNSDRFRVIDEENIKNYFNGLKYLSLDNLGYSPSNPDGNNLFLFDYSIGAVKKSLHQFKEDFIGKEEKDKIGDYLNLTTSINQKTVIKNNLFTSFALGSILDPLDDVNATLGRFSQRCYFKGNIYKNSSGKRILHIDEVGTRFVDEFSFDDKASEWYNPLTWKSQNLGCWKYKNFNKGDETVKRLAISEDWTCLENQNFNSLREKVKESGLNYCKDFLIYTDVKPLKFEYVQKDIIIF